MKLAFVRRLCICACLVWATCATAGDHSRATTTGEPSTPVQNTPIEPDWGLHLFGGASAGDAKLIELMASPIHGNYGDHYFAGVAISRRLIPFTGNWAVDGEIGAGYRFGDLHTPESWAAVFLRYNGFPWNSVVYTTAAVSTGLSYVATVPEVEHGGQGQGTRMLHYFSPELTFANPDNRNAELVLRYHHRSGVFGTFGGIREGSNVVTGGIRQRF